MGISVVGPPDREQVADFASDVLDAVLAATAEFPYDGHATERRTRIDGRRVSVTIAIGEPA